ncbi:uncharacterized protein LOC119690610 [Plutella xylostella]|uniref:uncharacterized protein LOC119690610 n=1 Tax=Plutella xylostella TaxID=51655 RepID=UPI002032FAED|nr:uncharacterized protein LOC119690610 [Plutella xylostella]
MLATSYSATLQQAAPSPTSSLHPEQVDKMKFFSALCVLVLVVMLALASPARACDSCGGNNNGGNNNGGGSSGSSSSSGNSGSSTSSSQTGGVLNNLLATSNS